MMEQKMKVIPFNLQLAKDIHGNKMKGKIITRENGYVRNIVFNVKDEDYPISAIIEVEENKETTETYTNEGKVNVDGRFDEWDLMLEVPEDTLYFGETVLAKHPGGFWFPAIYGFYDTKDGFHVIFGGQRFKECVPLKGHAHLIEGIVTFKNDINNGTDNVLSRENLPLQEV